MWSAPLKRTTLDGSQYHILLLDTEGIDAYDQTGVYSTQIFSLAILLSSMFIYNQMGGIDEAAIESLSLVSKVTDHIRVKASGGRTTISELGQFSPIFVWLLRDFYLDLSEDNQKITPRDYLELALRPMQGGGKAVSSKNEIRESIRSLFPVRECFTLVRPVNNEKDLQGLAQIPLDMMRPEFRSGLDALTKFVFERTRPKQVGATTMTGPIFAGLVQSFLDAINSGAVPTISSSWERVEEAECRRAYDSAVDIYNSSFDRTKPAEEDALREAHEEALRKAVDTFSASAVGAGSARLKYEKLLHNFLRKTFEDYKNNALLEADSRCSNKIRSMESKLRAACNLPGAKLDDVIRILDDLLMEYESSSYGPVKWKKLVTFLHQCLAGPVLDLFRRQLERIDAERNALRLKCSSSDDWKSKFDYSVSQQKAEEGKLKAQIASLESRVNITEGRLAAVREQAESAQEEASEWKRKYEVAVGEAKTALQRAAMSHERTNKKMQEREDALREEIANQLSEEEEEIARLTAKINQTKLHELQVESLERDKTMMVDAMEKLRRSEMDAVSNVALLEKRVDEREREIEGMLDRNNEQRSSTVQVLESLLETERKARDEANRRAEAMSLQLQATQGKLDRLQQELTSVRLNEMALDSKLKASQTSGEDNLGKEPVHDMDIDDSNSKQRKRSQSTTIPFKDDHTEDGESIQETDAEDYAKFTVSKLKQELTKHGFGLQLWQLRNSNKKDIVALYKKYVIGEK